MRQDIVDVCTKYVDVQLGALYINFDNCDPDCSRATDAGYVQHRVLQRHASAKARAAVEFRVFRHIVHPLRQRLAASGSFLARCPSTLGAVDLILTGSSLHGRDLRQNRLNHVVCVRMSADAFRQSYLAPLEEKALASTELY